VGEDFSRPSPRAGRELAGVLHGRRFLHGKLMTIPKLAEVNPAIGDIGARRLDLLAKAHALRTELFEVARAEQPAFAPAADDGVAVLLGREPNSPAVRREDRIAELNRQIRIHEAAAEVLAREVEAEIGKASGVIRERAAPEFHKRSRAVALAVVAAQKASAELIALQDALIDDGVVGATGMASLPHFLGNPNDPHGAANSWLREMAREGVLAAKELPAGAVQ